MLRTIVVLVVATLVALSVAAPNACRDTAICCQTFDFQRPSTWNAQPYGDVITQPVTSGVGGAWTDQGIQVSLDEIYALSGQPYPLGLVNVSKTSSGVTGADRVGVWPSEGLVLAAFEYFPTTLLRHTSSIRWTIVDRAPACVASVRTLRSYDFNHRQSVAVTTYRIDSVSGDHYQVDTAQRTWSIGDQSGDDTFEFTSLNVDEALIRFYGQGYGAVAAVEMCYHAPQGIDKCGVCAGPGVGCTGPGDSCTTGMSGACNSGTFDVNMTCVPNLSSAVEVCDGIDNNCNGLIDEGTWPTVECGVGACRRTMSTCINGEPNAACVPLSPSPEVCDGIDNNCNGLVDEDGVCNSPTITATTTASATPTPSATSSPSTTSLPTPSAFSSPSATPPPSLSSSSSATPSMPPASSTSVAPSGTPVPRPGSNMLVPLGTCVRQTDDADVWQAVFGYVYTGEQDVTIPVANSANWLQSDYTLNQPQPTTFRANQLFSRAFDVFFPRDGQVQWVLAMPNRTRQVALLNRHSHRCDTDLYTLESIQPHLFQCVHRVADMCTAHFGYTNPNPQTIELPVGPRNTFNVEPADRRQPRVFWPGLVTDAFVLTFDCSTPDWSFSWTVTDKTTHVTPSDLC